MKSLVKKLFRGLGLKVEKLDPEVEAIPREQHASPFIPKVYRETIGIVPFYTHMLDAAAGVPGAVVECGVLTGHSLLYMILLDLVSGRRRKYFAFDVFGEYLPNTDQKRMREHGVWAVDGYETVSLSIVKRTLRDGRVPEELIRDGIVFGKGFFRDTLPEYGGGPIAVLHLDCDLYDSYKDCLTNLYRHMASGGVILFDEYEETRFPGAKVAIDEFFSDKPEEVQEYNRYGHQKYYVQKS